MHDCKLPLMTARWLCWRTSKRDSWPRSSVLDQV